MWTHGRLQAADLHRCTLADVTGHRQADLLIRGLGFKSLAAHTYDLGARCRGRPESCWIRFRA